jgi:hypothetical protein
MTAFVIVPFPPSSWRRSHVITRDAVARASIQDCPLQGATWLCVRRTDRSSVTVGLNMESAFTFLTLSPFLYSPDNFQFPSFLSFGPWRWPAPPSSDLVHLAQFFITPHAHNLTLRAIVTIANPIPLIITSATLLSSINHLDSLPTRHNNSFIPFDSNLPSSLQILSPSLIQSSPSPLKAEPSPFTCQRPPRSRRLSLVASLAPTIEFQTHPFMLFSYYTAHTNLPCHR